jgi:hypothetical protein
MGLWVVYFSLAALPLFGLGQSLIPAEATGRRQYTFWLMVVYVGSGLGLLLTTCLLGMRRYLRQRRLQMPVAMTGLWLGSGAALIVAFLLVGAFLPRPLAEYPLVSLRPVGSTDRDASRFAPNSNTAGKGDGRPGADGKGDAAKDGSGGKGQSGGKESGRSGKAEGSGEGKGKGGGESKGERGGENKGSGKSNDQQKGQEQSNNSNSSTPNPPEVASGALAVLANIVKWIVFAVVLLVVMWFVLRRLASVFEWARQLLDALTAFWRSLFGGSAPVEDDVEEAVVVRERPRPFADFRNPFADGSAAGRSPEELVSYSFAALEAWATERDLPRRIDETPLEFSARIGEQVPDLNTDAQRLTVLYARLAYARRRLPDTCRKEVAQFWQQLESVPEQRVVAERNGSAVIAD